MTLGFPSLGIKFQEKIREL